MLVHQVGEQFVRTFRNEEKKNESQKTFTVPFDWHIANTDIAPFCLWRGNCGLPQTAPETTELPATEEATSAPTEAPVAEVTGTLSVLEWAGYDAEDFWVDFKKPTPTSL